MSVIFVSCLFLMTVFAIGVVSIPLLKINQRRLSLTVLILLPVCSLFFYYLWGNFSGIHRYWYEQEKIQLVKKELTKIKNPQQLIVIIKNHLKLDSKDANGWYLLGKIYFSIGQYDLADKPFQTAVQFNPNHAEFIIAYEQNYLIIHRHLTSEMINKTKALIKNPLSSIDALNLLAMNAYLQKKYPESIHYWQLLLNQKFISENDRKVILMMIARAQKTGSRENL